MLKVSFFVELRTDFTQNCGASNSQKIIPKKRWSFCFSMLSLLGKKTIFVVYVMSSTCQSGQPAANGKSHGASDLKRAAWEKPDHQSPEKLKMNFQMHSGSHLATGAQNSSNWASKGHLRATWPPEPRKALPFLALVVQWLPSWPQAATFCFLTCQVARTQDKP